jgi:hypothetical protein
MHDDKRDQFVDELLEASLKRYRGEEPGSGLEMRILAGIRTRERAARWRGLGWAVAVCAGVLVAFVLTLRFVHTPLRQPAPRASLLQPVTTPPAMVSQQQPRGSGGAEPGFSGPRLVQGPKEKPRTPKPPCGPKPSGGRPGVRASKRPEQFPTPFPLTEQEKLLLALLNKATKPDLVAQTNDTDEAPVSDLEIPRIKIAALEIKPLDDSQSQQEK